MIYFIIYYIIGVVLLLRISFKMNDQLTLLDLFGSFLCGTFWPMIFMDDFDTYFNKTFDKLNEIIIWRKPQ